MSERGRLAGIVTSIALIAISSATMVYGLAVARATLDMRRLYDEVAERPGNASSAYAEIVDQTRLWSEVPGTQVPAYDLRIEVANAVIDAEALKNLDESLVAQLSIEPAASVSWARLARARALRERPMAEVEQALRMSMLTGRYEMAGMQQRLLLAMPLWDDLSEELRQGMRSEIRAMSPYVNRFERERILAVAQTLPREVWEHLLDEFRQGLRAQ